MNIITAYTKIGKYLFSLITDLDLKNELGAKNKVFIFSNGSYDTPFYYC